MTMFVLQNVYFIWEKHIHKYFCSPLLNSWGQKNAKAVIVYIVWHTHFPEAENFCTFIWKILYFPTCMPTSYLYQQVLNMMKYWIKNIFKDSLKWAFSLCLIMAVSTCLHCDLWQRVAFQNFINGFKEQDAYF